MTEKPALKINIRFIYSYCTDIASVRKFYSECLGMLERSYHNDENFAWLNYQCEGLNYMFFRAKEGARTCAGTVMEKVDLPRQQEGFAAQPGGGGGDILVPSWSIEVPEDQYSAVIERLRGAGFSSNHRSPLWLQDSYWGYVVKDPAGNTVEVFSTPKTKPASTQWQA